MINDEDRKVLFLVQQFEPYPRACELCVINVQKSLYQLGIESDVLELSGEKGMINKSEYGKIYSLGFVKPILYKGNSVLNKIKRAMHWPLFDNRESDLYKKAIDELNIKNGYSAIIGVTLPVAPSYVGVMYDNFILYELDSIVNNPSFNKGIRRIYKNRIKKIEEYIYDRAKLLIHMECNRKYLEGLNRNHNFVYADVPNLVTVKNIRTNKECADKTIKAAYFGVLSRTYRNPQYLIELLKEINNNTPMKCDFYSRGDCESMISNAVNYNNSIFAQNGYVDKDVVLEKQQEADVLISIGNKIKGNDYSLPSKIIDYIATGKPIIHIYGGKNDSAISYLKKYELAYIIDPKDSLKDNAKKVITFANESKGRQILFDEIEKIFYRNTPQYTANIIKEYLDGIRG